MIRLNTLSKSLLTLSLVIVTITPLTLFAMYNPPKGDGAYVQLDSETDSDNENNVFRLDRANPCKILNTIKKNAAEHEAEELSYMLQRSLSMENISLCDIKNAWNKTALHIACEEGDWNGVNVVLNLTDEPGKTIDLLCLKDNFGYSALHLAILNDHTKIAKHLIDTAQSLIQKKSADSKMSVLWKMLSMQSTYEGDTPLHCAALGGKTTIIKMIVTQAKQLGKDDELRSIKNMSGQTAQDIFDQLGKDIFS